MKTITRLALKRSGTPQEISSLPREDDKDEKEKAKGLILKIKAKFITMENINTKNPKIIAYLKNLALSLPEDKKSLTLSSVTPISSRVISEKDFSDFTCFFSDCPALIKFTASIKSSMNMYIFSRLIKSSMVMPSRNFTL